VTHTVLIDFGTPPPLAYVIAGVRLSLAECTDEAARKRGCRWEVRANRTWVSRFEKKMDAMAALETARLAMRVMQRANLRRAASRRRGRDERWNR